MGDIASRVVLVAPLRSSLGLSGSHDGLAVADLRHPDAVETMLAGFMHGGDTPIVTCAANDVEDVRRLLTFTAIRSPGFRAAQEPLPGSPLAVGVLSSLVDDLNDPDGLETERTPRDHFGPVGMRERAESIGGPLDLATRSGAGTTITVHAPRAAITEGSS